MHAQPAWVIPPIGREEDWIAGGSGSSGGEVSVEDRLCVGIVANRFVTVRRCVIESSIDQGQPATTQRGDSYVRQRPHPRGGFST